MPNTQHSRHHPEPPYQDDTDNLKLNVVEIWSAITDSVKGVYDKATATVGSEFSVPVSQQQLNAALKQFVTDNVTQILEIRVELHQDWFRLFCTIEASGIYAEVASNFSLVHVQLDRDVQRFVFGQLTNTDLLNLRCESFVKRLAIKGVVWFYHSILKKDPLGFILSYINIAYPKDNIIYLSIHRWLKKNQKIMSTLHKAQVNYGEVEEEQLIFKTKVNIRDLLSNSSQDDIITPDDEPELMEGPINPIDDATTPSHA